METVLKVENVSKKYPSFSLKRVSFEAEKGKIMGFIGRNGAGKSTTLKCMLGFVHRDEGKIYYFGRDFDGNEREVKSLIGFVPGGVDYYLTKKLKTITDVTRRFYPEWSDETYRRYMAEFSLDENKTPKELSAGMKVKYSLVLALSHNAQLLILDEPTSGLDPVSRDEILDIFLNLSDRGVTVLFSTHITSDLEKCADDITYIRNGTIICSEQLKTFAKKYSLVTFEQTETLDNRLIGALIGTKRAKEGYTAIVENAKISQAITTGAVVSAATLDDIMIHYEKEESENA